MNLKTSVSSDFPCLKTKEGCNRGHGLTACQASILETSAAIDIGGLYNLSSLKSPIPSKNLPNPDGLIITGTKISNTGHFLWNG